MKRLLTICIVLAICGTAQAATVTCTDCTDGTTTGKEAAVLTKSLLPPSVPLSEVFRTWVEGDYVAAGAGLRSSASGTITISLPAGAVVRKAFLYWSIMEDSDTPSADLYDVTFNGNPVTGLLVGTAGSPCWDPNRIHNFVANVTGLETDGGNAVTLASTPAGILREGASLVVIFDDPATPGVYKEVIIQQGAVTFVGSPAESTTFSGFNAVGGSATTTWIVADGQRTDPNLNNRIFDDDGEVANHTLGGDDPPAGNYWDTRTDTVGDACDGSITLEILSDTNGAALDCLTWVAQVLSVEFDPTVFVDIKPGSCPNPFNPKSRGSVPVAISSTADFCVNQIRLGSITLTTPSGNVVPALGRHIIRDVTEPYDGDPNDCHDCFDEDDPANFNCDLDPCIPGDDAYCGDGYIDLIVKFNARALAAAIGWVPRDTCIVLTLNGRTWGGAPILGSDSVLIRRR
ncbi:MAG: DUF3344 domain-containing protein [Planctomycetota bacterium]|jgi:hypothetical protein